MFACPFFDFATLTSVAIFLICEICLWEDDGQDDPDADKAFSGPKSTNLTQARKNFLGFDTATIVPKSIYLMAMMKILDIKALSVIGIKRNKTK